MNRRTIQNKLRWSTMLLAVAFMFYACNDEDDSSTSLIEDSMFSEHPDNGKIIPGQYIVVMRPEAVTDRVKLARDYSEKQELMMEETNSMLSELEINNVERVYSEALYGFVAKLDDAGLAKLRNDTRIERIENDRLIIMRPPWERDEPGDGDDGGGDDDGSSTQSTPYGIARVNGGVTYTGNSRAWIIDTGIEYGHEDLNIDRNGEFTAFTSGPDARDANDLNGHGTHVAGTVAAKDNNLGVIGVAAGAPVVPIKVLDRRGSGSIGGVVAGVDHVTANAKSGDVANMSLGGGANTTLDNAVKALGNKGVKVAIAAGNSGTHANNASPARATGTNLYAVSAMDSNDNWASFSNYGNPPVRYCQPGVAVNSTWINNGYRSISGTSMAAPHLCGLLLLGSIKTDGTVNGDPDGNPDPIAVR